MRSEKTYSDPQLGQVTIRKNSLAKRISIRVLPIKGVIVTIPRWAPYRIGEVFLSSKKEWVEATLKRMEQRNNGMNDLQAEIGPRVEAWRKEAHATLPPRLRELAARYGFEPGRITIRHNSSNWGSCSSKGNISLNLNLVRLPRHMQDYVMLHELCHLRHMNHGKEFHALLEELCLKEFGEDFAGDNLHIILRKELKSYILL